MVLYRRNRLAGATYFFTVALADRSTGLLVEHIGRLRYAYSLIYERHPFRTDAIVILPDHLHCIWTLPESDDRYSMRWRLIKTVFTTGLLTDGVIAGRRSKGERRIWLRRFWEHTIRDADDLQRHVDYIHFNPVKHGHVERVADWPYSSFHRHVAQGLLPMDWAGSAA